MKIGFKLTMIMVILGLFSVGAVGITLLVRSSSTIREMADDNVRNLAKQSASEIASYFNSYWYTAETFAQLLGQYDDFSIDRRRLIINAMIEGLLVESPEILAAWCCFEPDVLEGNDRQYGGMPGSHSSGRFAPYWYRKGDNIEMDILTDFDVTGIDGDFYFLARDSDSTQIIEPYWDNVGGTEVFMTSFACPIHSQDGKVAGVAGVDIALDELQRITMENKPYDNAVTAAFSNSGIIVGHFDASRIGRNIRETEQDMAGPYMNDFVISIHEGELFAFSNFIDALGETLEIVSVPVFVGDSEEPTPWSYAIGVFTKTVMAPVTAMTNITIVIIVIVLAVVVIAAIFFSRSISRPIVNVAETLKDISEGEGDLTRSIAVNSKDEIGSLALYFNNTLEKIKNLIIVIKKQSVTLSNTGSELASNMNETAAAINEITANIQSIKARVLNQSASVSETHATMEQVVANINKLGLLVEDQSSNISQASSAIEEMVANTNSVTNTLVNNENNVNSLQEASEVGRNGLQEVASDIQEISREAEGLMEINSVMENIASQTNLLSMNAAIEAAHAGEAGKGFAVVADEIRKLAESSSEQSKTIGSVLKKIKTSIDKITNSSENVLTRFEAIDSSVKIVSEQEENIRHAMEEQGIGSRQILNGVGNVNEITQQVKSSSKEMLDGSKEVITESNNLEKVTQEITSGMNEMASGADQINVAVNHVNEISNKNREDIALLMKEVARFKIE